MMFVSYVLALVLDALADLTALSLLALSDCAKSLQ